MISMFHKMREREGGFTLVELLVVIVILGILIAIAVPTFLSQQDKANGAKVESYLNTAYKDAKADSVDFNGQFTGGKKADGTTYTTSDLATAIGNSEPEFKPVVVVSAPTKAALAAATPAVDGSDGHQIAVVDAQSNPATQNAADTGTTGSNLELVGVASNGEIYTLTVTDNGAVKVQDTGNSIN